MLKTWLEKHQEELYEEFSNEAILEDFAYDKEIFQGRIQSLTKRLLKQHSVILDQDSISKSSFWTLDYGFDAETLEFNQLESTPVISTKSTPIAPTIPPTPVSVTVNTLYQSESLAERFVAKNSSGRGLKLTVALNLLTIFVAIASI